MESTFKKTKNEGVIKFSGDMTVQHAINNRDVLIKALKATDKVLLDFENVTDVDLAGLQLLCSAHRTVILSGKQISCIGPLPEVMRKAVERAGYDRLIGCREDGQESCIWMPKIKEETLSK